MTSSSMVSFEVAIRTTRSKQPTNRFRSVRIFFAVLNGKRESYDFFRTNHFCLLLVRFLSTLDMLRMIGVQRRKTVREIRKISAYGIEIIISSREKSNVCFAFQGNSDGVKLFGFSDQSDICSLPIGLEKPLVSATNPFVLSFDGNSDSLFFVSLRDHSNFSRFRSQV